MPDDGPVLSDEAIQTLIDELGLDADFANNIDHIAGWHTDGQGTLTAATVEMHLQGKHDQRMHGRGGANASVPSPDGKGDIALVGTATGKGTPDDPIYVDGDLDQAVATLAEGKSIRLDSDKQASILVDKMGKNAEIIKAQGKKAPDMDLCKVTTPNGNLFCHDNKGIPRAEMPQLAGRTTPGSKAESMKHNINDPDEWVDATPEFIASLQSSGIAVKDHDVPVNQLRATQNQINGSKVGAIYENISKNGIDRSQPLWVTRDGYVLDGHHRWAAEFSVDLNDGNVGNLPVPVHEIDMEIGAALDYSKAFSRDFGIKQEGVSAPSAKKAATRG